MYSRRRYRRTYRNKTNGIYSPSNKNYNLPSYKQKVGRTLQASPRILTNNTTTMISRPVLDEYYKLLVRYKYPMSVSPIPPAPQYDYTEFFYNFKTDFISISDWPEVINLDYLYNNFVQQEISTLPPAPDGYSYGFSLRFIDFTYVNNNTVDSDQFNFSWDISLTGSPQAIIAKTLNTTAQLNFNGEIYASVGGPQFMRYSQVTFTQSSINYRYSSFSTNSDITGEDLYPFMTSLENHPAYDASIAISINSGPTNTNSSFALGLQIFFVSNN